MEESDVSLSRVNGVGSFEEDFLPVNDDRAEVDAEAFRFCERLQIHQEGVDAPGVLSWRKSFALV
jgi:zona occludens toxin (predicted ATPase)